MKGMGGVLLIIAAFIAAVVIHINEIEKKDKEISKLKHDLQVCQTTHKR